MYDFFKFLLNRAYIQEKVFCKNVWIEEALHQYQADVNYYDETISKEQIIENISNNSNALAVFLFRLSSIVYQHAEEEKALLNALTWIMKDCCACEIYYSNKIDVGFAIQHSVGIVIGSRNKIGKGFRIYQCCTIGHKQPFETGCIIGDNVVMYASSCILGPVSIGDDCVIGNNCVIRNSLNPKTICHGYTTVVSPYTKISL